MIVCIIGISVTVIICLLHYLINERPFEKEPLEQPKPFIVSEYYSRIEQATLDILEAQEPIDKIIILWWGLDGLRLNEDGTLEWISRKKPVRTSAVAPTYYWTPGGRGGGSCYISQYGVQNISQQISWQMDQMCCQINQPIAQMTAQLDQQLNSVRWQIAQNAQNAAMMNAMQMQGYVGCQQIHATNGYITVRTTLQ